MSDIWKLLGLGLGAFTGTFCVAFWVLQGAPLPYFQFKYAPMKPDPRISTFQQVEGRLGRPDREEPKPHEPEHEPEGDKDPRRTKYRMVLKEAIEAVEADHCAAAQRQLLAVALTAYIKAKLDDIACPLCFWGKSEDEVFRDWETPFDKHLIERLNQLIASGHLAREDFKEPPVLLGLRSRAGSPGDC